ncbi:MAG: hypothetical protein GXX89_01390 [Clostridiales bacterium]|nr:hypothetical protein [Clostridiales bacterium]
MKRFENRIVVFGAILILFGIMLAVAGNTTLVYITGGLGLFLAAVGCFAPYESSEKKKDDGATDDKHQGQDNPL